MSATALLLPGWYNARGSAPAFVSANTTDSDEVSVASLEVTPPAGSAGDLVLALVVVRSGATVSTPSGWSVAEGPTGVSTSVNAYVFSRVAEAGDGTVTFTPSASAAMRATLVRVANGEVEDVDSASGTGTDAAAPALTASGNSRVAVAMYAGRNNPAGSSGPAGYTAADTGDLGGDVPAGAAYYKAVNSGAVGAATFTFGATNTWAAFHLVVKGT